LIFRLFDEFSEKYTLPSAAKEFYGVSCCFFCAESAKKTTAHSSKFLRWRSRRS